VTTQWISFEVKVDVHVFALYNGSKLIDKHVHSCKHTIVQEKILYYYFTASGTEIHLQNEMSCHFY